MQNIQIIFLFSLIAAICHYKNAAEAQAVADYGHCIWYGVGDVNPDKPDETTIGDNNLNAAYNGEAKLLENAPAIEALYEQCPTMYEEIMNDYGELVTCCDAQNIEIMVSQFGQIDTFLGRCPACVQNLKADFCYMTCHPRHSSFLIATEYYNVSVYSINYYLNPSYAIGTYDSCAGVYYPELNTEAIFLFCGGYGTECNPKRLFDFLGDNEFSPFLIDYRYTSQTVVAYVNDTAMNMTSMNALVVPCSTNDTTLSCACADCIEKCPPPPTGQEEEEPPMVGAVYLNGFVLILVWGIFSIVVAVYFIWFRDPGRSEKIRKISFNLERSAKLDEFLIEKFTQMETKIAQKPFWSLLGGLICIIALSLGNIMLEMTADPVELWSSPDSRTREEKDYYDENFGPFYRTTQIIATPIGLDYFVREVPVGIANTLVNRTFGPALNPEFMRAVFELQAEVLNLTAQYEGRTVTINDVCIKPLAPSNDECLLQTVFNYWQNNATYLMSQMNNSSEYLSWFHQCTRNPTYSTIDETCLGTYGGPVLPYVALGGFLGEGETLADDPNYDLSTAFVMSYLLENYVDKDDTEPARAWEEVFLNYMEDYSHPLIDFAYYSERSIEDELIEEGKSDISTIVISYVIMFAYVTIALGSTTFDKNYFITSKMSLGLAGVIIVLLSVLSSMGFYGYVGVKSTIFVVEVVPFLVLAIGVDNIFLMVQNLQRTKLDLDDTIEEHVGKAVGQVLPSILITTCSEALCFFLGSLSKMPAVRSFALCAGMALVINFFLQITCFVAIMTLDAKRERSNRYDVLCCIKKSEKNYNDHKENGVCFKLFRDAYGPFLTHKYTQMAVLIIFVGGFLVCCAFIPRIPVGLEQDTAFASDSYLIKYFDFLATYLSVGTPIYFVVKEGFDYTKVGEQNLFCSTYGCRDDSILTQILMASFSPDVSYVATGPSSWLESYFAWISDTGDPYILFPEPETACCRLDENGTFIDSSESEDYDTVEICLKESEGDFYDEPYDTRPKSELFMIYLPDFLIDNPHGTRCPEAGHPAYGDAVNIIGEEGTNTSFVGANYYMAYHTILKTSADFTNALDMAYFLTDQLTDYLEKYSNTSVEIFPYSIFYVYYEQYLTMWEATAFILGISTAGVIIVMLCLTGFDILTTFINTVVITMIVCDLMGCMYGWNIDLNAVSLVNIVMTIGISVEFTSHFTHAFNQLPSGTRRERTIDTLAATGTSILSGITLTKFAGIIVLAFANSEIFKIYYFRMFLLMVLLGVSHGLIFLPALTSLIGHPSNPYISIVEAKSEKTSREKAPSKPSDKKKATNGVVNSSFAHDDSHI